MKLLVLVVSLLMAVIVEASQCRRVGIVCSDGKLADFKPGTCEATCQRTKSKIPLISGLYEYNHISGEIRCIEEISQSSDRKKLSIRAIAGNCEGTMIFRWKGGKYSRRSKGKSYTISPFNSQTLIYKKKGSGIGFYKVCNYVTNCPRSSN